LAARFGKRDPALEDETRQDLVDEFMSTGDDSPAWEARRRVSE